MIKIIQIILFVIFICVPPVLANLKNDVVEKPIAIAIDRDGYIFVLSGNGTWRYELRKYNSKGELENILNRTVLNLWLSDFDAYEFVRSSDKLSKKYEGLIKYLKCEPVKDKILEKIIYPRQITIGTDGGIYVIADDIYGKTSKIGIIDPNDGHTIFTFGKSGSGEADLWHPKGIAVDKDGNIYVTNHVYSSEGKKLYAVKKYDNKGKFIKSWGTWGGGAGEFKDPWAIAVDDKNSYIYVTDVFYPSWMRGTGEDDPQERINKFTKDGKFIKSWGGNKITGVAVLPPKLIVDPDFLDPVGLAVDSKGYVFVLEDDRARVSKFDGEGNLIEKWGKPGTGQKEFRNPQSIAIDKNDNVYIADTGNNRIQKVDSNGKFLMEIK